MFYRLLTLTLAAGLLAGCGSILPGRKALPGPSAAEIYQARREPPAPIQAAISTLPQTPTGPAVSTTVPTEPLPIWKDAQVTRVELDAYVNENGEAFGPSVKYVVKQAGGWNIDALRNPHRAYVPTENVPPIPSSSGFSANPMIAPGEAATPSTQTPGVVGAVQPSIIQRMTDVRVTGFVEKSQETYARAMAKPGETPLFDEAMGWILVPQSVLVPANQLPMHH